MSTTSSIRINQDVIDRAMAISLADIASARGLALRKLSKASPEHVGPCPRCGRGIDRFSVNTIKQVFNCRVCGEGGRGAIAFVQWLDGCGFREAVEILVGERSSPAKSIKFVAAKNSDAAYEREQRRKASWLWSQRLPITGSIAETYLRKARDITCPLPPTLAFLPPTRPGHHPALISEFGLCDETEPGVLIARREPLAVHLTLLKPDGSGKIDAKPNKLMIGSPTGRPIVVAPPDDRIELVITEGIEDALSIHQATGLGAWAAGSAPHMPPLADAVPDWIEGVVVIADANRTGRENSMKLAARLDDRGIFAEVLSCRS